MTFAQDEAGDLSDVPGVGTPYETPRQPDVIDNGKTRAETVASIVAQAEDTARRL